MKTGDTDGALSELDRHLTAARASVHEQVRERDAVSPGS
jgi:hypothetical protein